MNCGNPARMARIPGLEKIQCFTASHLANDDALGRAAETDAAGPAADILKITELAQLAGRFQKVRLGNPVRVGDILIQRVATDTINLTHTNATTNAALVQARQLGSVWNAVS